MQFISSQNIMLNIYMVLLAISAIYAAQSIFKTRNYDTLKQSIKNGSFPLDIKIWHGTVANRLFPVMKLLADKYPETRLKMLPLDDMLLKYRFYPLVGEKSSMLMPSLFWYQTRFSAPNAIPDTDARLFGGNSSDIDAWKYANGDYALGESDFLKIYGIDNCINNMRIYSASLKSQPIDDNGLWRFVEWATITRSLNQERYFKALKELGVDSDMIKNKLHKYSLVVKAKSELFSYMESFDENNIKISSDPDLKKYLASKGIPLSDSLNDIFESLYHLFTQMMSLKLQDPTQFDNVIEFLRTRHEEQSKESLIILDKLILAFENIVDPSTDTTIRLSNEKLQELNNENIPLIIASTKNLETISLPHDIGERILVNRRPMITKDLDTLILLEKDYQRVLEYLKSLNANLKEVKFVLFNEN